MKLATIACGAPLALAAGFAQASPPEDFDARAEAVRKMAGSRGWPSRSSSTAKSRWRAVTA